MAADEIRESIAQDGATHRDGYPDAIDQGETHSEGCWRWKGHHNCAVERVVWFERYQRQMASLVARLRSQVQTLEDLHLYLLRRPVEAAPESDTSQKPHTSLHSDVSGSGDVSEEDEPPSREPLLQVVWRCRSCGAQPGEPGCKECHR